jgi:hypothetical protein
MDSLQKPSAFQVEHTVVRLLGTFRTGVLFLSVPCQIERQHDTGCVSWEV